MTVDQRIPAVSDVYAFQIRIALCTTVFLSSVALPDSKINKNSCRSRCDNRNKSFRAVDFAVMNNGTVFCNQIVRIGNASVEAFLRHRNHFCKGSRIVAVFRVALRRLQDIINFRIGHVILHNTRCRNHNLALSHIDEEADTVWLFRILFVIKIICNRLTVLGTTAALGQDDHMELCIALELCTGSLEVLLLLIGKK